MAHKASLRLFALLVFFGTFWQSASAQIHTLCVKGIVRSVNDGTNALAGTITAGDSVDALIKYDLSTPAATTSIYNTYYETFDTPSGIYISINNRFFGTDTNYTDMMVAILNDTMGKDVLGFNSYYNAFFPPFPFTITPGSFIGSSIVWSMEDTSQTALTNVSQPININLASWPQINDLHIMATSQGMDSTVDIFITVTSVDTCNPAIPSAVAQVNPPLKVSLYPNPFNGSTMVQFSAGVQAASIRMYDVYGRMVKAMENVSGEKVEINREGLASGVYYLQVAEGGKVVATQKLVVMD